MLFSHFEPTLNQIQSIRKNYSYDSSNFSKWSAGGRPTDLNSRKGTNMTMARLAVALSSNGADNGEATFWLGVIAFGKLADAAKHRKGDLISVAGQPVDGARG